MAASDRILVDMGQYAGILPTTLDRPQNTWLLCGDAGGSASDDANCDRSLSGLRWLRIVASPMRSQGQRTLSAFSCKDLQQVIKAPTGLATLHDIAFFARMLLDQA